MVAVTINTDDKASQLSVSRDGMTLTSEQAGYRMARAVVGVSEGVWYYECLVCDKPKGHYRLGWATKHAFLQAPVGFDKHGFGYRDVAGSRVHAGNRIDHYGEEFGPGDVIGCLIVLTGNNRNHIRFFRNGVDQGIAFKRVPDGTYLPAFSLYGPAQCTVNFGPVWQHPPEVTSESDLHPGPPKPISDLSFKIRHHPKREVAESSSTRTSKRHRS